MAYSAKSIANGLLQVAQSRGKNISNMKLQKLLYFAHGFWLANTGQPLIDEAPEAWQYGPVYPSAYHQFKDCGSGAITHPATQVDFQTFSLAPVPLPDEEVMGFLNAVYETYGSQSAIELSRLSHLPGSPWDQARRISNAVFGAQIPDSSTQPYFTAWLNQSRPAAPDQVHAVETY